MQECKLEVTKSCLPCKSAMLCIKTLIQINVLQCEVFFIGPKTDDSVTDFLVYFTCKKQTNKKVWSVELSTIICARLFVERERERERESFEPGRMNH